MLASADFAKEVTTSVIWLNDHGIDIRCVRLKPYDLDGRVLVDVQQIIPLPEAAEYQVQVREKVQKERQIRASGKDFTKFDVRFDGIEIQSMWKRNAIFEICKRLCDKGINPDEIADLFDQLSVRVWYSVAGEIGASDFVSVASEAAKSTGTNFDPDRWFRRDDQLIHANGKTYAFTSQWGEPRWSTAMNLIKESYPQFHIDFTAASSSLVSK